MKKTSFLFICLVLLAFTSKAQNADNLYFNSTTAGFDYQASSFVIDTALPAYPFRRAMLLWATNTGTTAASRTLSLDETLDNGVPVTEHINLQNNVSFKGLMPKKIIRSRFSKNYYLLAHVLNSPNLITGIAVASSAFVLKLDDNLNLVWSSKIHFNPVTTANAQALIEYNDIIETADKHVVIVGRFARTQTDRQGVLMTKLDQTTGGILWQWQYFLWSCHANGLSVAEAFNGELCLTGYAEQCTLPSFGGVRQLLFGKTKATGVPLQFRKFLNTGNLSGDKITRFFTSTTGNDRFFITGFVDVQTAVAGVFDRQNLVVDISQLGNVNAAAHFGDRGSEEVNDHIFARTAVANILQLNLTGYTTSYATAAEAYYCTLRYNAGTFTFTIVRFDVLRNVYPGTTYNSRRGIEIKLAGPSRFAILLNSSLTTTTPLPVYTHAFTNVFVRDLTMPANDTLCYRPKFPPLTPVNWHFLDTVAGTNPTFIVYPETWTQSPKIQNKLLCGQIWKIYPGQAVLALVFPPDQYEGPGDVVPTARPAAVVQPAIGKNPLFPNPANSEVTVALDKQFAQQPKPITIRLLSPEMRQVSTESFGYQPRHTIGLKALAPGVYFIELIQGDRKSVV